MPQVTVSGRPWMRGLWDSNACFFTLQYIPCLSFITISVDSGVPGEASLTSLCTFPPAEKAHTKMSWVCIASTLRMQNPCSSILLDSECQKSLMSVLLEIK